MQLLKGLFSPNAAETLRGWRFPLSLNIFFPFSWRGRWLYLSPIQTAVALIYPFVITSYPMLFTNENLSRSFWLVETSSPSQHSVPGQRLIFLHIWTCLLHIPAATNSPISLLSSGLFLFCAIPGADRSGFSLKKGQQWQKGLSGNWSHAIICSELGTFVCFQWGVRGKSYKNSSFPGLSPY